MKDFAKMNIKPQGRGRTFQKERPLHIGFDTETLHGKMRLIALSNPTSTGRYGKDYLYLDVNDNEEGGAEKILSFLCQPRLVSSVNWFYNLDYDFRAILRWFPRRYIEELYDEGETVYSGFKVKYLARKFFSVTKFGADVKNNRAVTFYDVMQFYPGGLDVNAQKYLGIGKLKNVDSAILGSRKKYWLDHLPEVITYCIRDSALAAALGQLLYAKLWSSLKFNPAKPFSCGSISQEYFINNSPFIPTIKDIPQEILAVHQNNYRGGRIEIMKRGFFEGVNSYDLKSAYPAEMVNLMDYSAGTWVRSTDFDEDVHGMYKVEYSWIHPTLGFVAVTMPNIRGVESTLYPVTNMVEGWMNEQELRVLSDHPQFGEFKILEGWSFHPYREMYPYRSLIEKLFELKEGADDKTERMLYKLFINSIYGKTAQAIYDRKMGKFATGKLYNPVYSCRITANTRIKLLEAGLGLGGDVIGFATDAVLTTGTHVKTGSGLGDFELEYCAKEGVVLMAGVRYMDDSQKVRGFGGGFNLKDSLLANPTLRVIPVRTSAPITLFQGLNYNKFNEDDINVFNPVLKELDINGDYRRIWADDFVNCQDVLSRNISSAPYGYGDFDRR